MELTSIIRPHFKLNWRGGLDEAVRIGSRIEVRLLTSGLRSTAAEDGSAATLNSKRSSRILVCGGIRIAPPFFPTFLFTGSG